MPALVVKHGEIPLSLFETRNAAHFNNRDDLVNLSFILKVLVFSEVYLEPSRTSMMKLFANIAESCSLFLQKCSVIDARLSSKYDSGFTNTLSTSRFFKVFYFFQGRF